MLHAALTNCSGAKDSDFEKGRHFLTGVLRSNDEERLSLSECREEARHSWPSALSSRTLFFRNTYNSTQPCLCWGESGAAAAERQCTFLETCNSPIRKHAELLFQLCYAWRPFSMASTLRRCTRCDRPSQSRPASFAGWSIPCFATAICASIEEVTGSTDLTYFDVPDCEQLGEKKGLVCGQCSLL